jgi:hypothetical protein
MVLCGVLLHLRHSTHAVQIQKEEDRIAEEHLKVLKEPGVEREQKQTIEQT